MEESAARGAGEGNLGDGTISCTFAAVHIDTVTSDLVVTSEGSAYVLEIGTTPNKKGQ